MSARDRVEELRRVVREARAMPMSASVVVNRADVTALLDALREELDAELATADQVVTSRQDVVADGQREAEELVAAGREEQQRLASETEVLRAARERAEAEVAEARREAAAHRKEADEYVDGKLAGFEITLERTLETVRRGRERLAGDGDLDALGTDDVDEIKLPGHLEG